MSRDDDTTNEHHHREPESKPFWDSAGLMAALALGLSLAAGFGTYSVVADHVSQHDRRLEKLEAAREVDAKAQAELDKRISVGEAQTAAILEAIHRVESKIDHLTAREK